MSEVALAALDDIANGDHRIFRVGTLEVGVFRVQDKVFAWENRCPHAGGPVCQGKIYRKVEEVLGEDRKSLGLRFPPDPADRQPLARLRVRHHHRQASGGSEGAPAAGAGGSARGPHLCPRARVTSRDSSAASRSSGCCAATGAR